MRINLNDIDDEIGEAQKAIDEIEWDTANDSRIDCALSRIVDALSSIVARLRDMEDGE